MPFFALFFGPVRTAGTRYPHWKYRLVKMGSAPNAEMEWADNMRVLFATVRRVSLAGATCALALSLVSGCCRQVDMWTPQPRVHWSDIETRPVEPVRDGYHLLKDEPSRGLFPASIAVTRVAVGPDKERPELRRKHLLRDPRNEFLRWNAAFDDQMAVSEVFPIDQRDLGGADGEPEQVLAAFHALHARVGFVYGVNELSECATEMIGVLYDVNAGEPIASIHAQAASVAPLEDDEDPEDLWQTDSRALVRADFERHLYECIRALIAQDEPAAVESPTGWTPAGPVRPVEWPPRFTPGW